MLLNAQGSQNIKPWIFKNLLINFSLDTLYLIAKQAGLTCFHMATVSESSQIMGPQTG